MMIRQYMNTIFFFGVLFWSSIFQANLVAKVKLNQDFLILHDTMNSGIGAEFSAVLGALDAYEKGQYSGLEVNLDSGVFFDPVFGPNWWEYYFEPICLGDKFSNEQHHSSVGECCVLSSTAYNQLSRKQDFTLIRKYVHVKPVIMDAVSEFVEKNFAGSFVIGIHHRGTDKVTEVAMVPWELTLDVLQFTISRLSRADKKKLKIYVATDDQNFLDCMLRLYPSSVVYGDFSRSTDNQPLHYYESQYYANNYEKGKEAIIEALILANCDALIRPAPSGFSWISMVFNPWMPVNSINCGGWVFPGKWSPLLHR